MEKLQTRLQAVRVPHNMEEVYEQLEVLKEHFFYGVGEAQSVVENLPEAAEKYFKTLQNASMDDYVRDFSAFKVSALTVSATVTAVVGLLTLGSLLSGSMEKKTKKPKKKKQSRAQKVNHEIQEILDFVEETYVPQIDEYLQNYTELKEEDVEYKYKYFEEMLLKELMKLDGIDVSGNDVLRDNRKKVIKFVQDHQRRLDKFKREVQF